MLVNIEIGFPSRSKLREMVCKKIFNRIAIDPDPILNRDRDCVEKFSVKGEMNGGAVLCPEIIIRLADEGTVVDDMLVGVMSDTHDNIAQTKKAVSRFNHEGVEQVLHAGDFVSPFMIDTLKELAAPLTGVFGNNDGDRSLLEKKSAAVSHLKIAGTFARIDAGGLRIAILHGNDRELLKTLAGCGCLDLLVYGHTHRPEIRRDGSLLIVNPGEVYGHLTGKSTVALVDTVKQSAEIVEI